jgi:predicted phage terminase large subunit-like protein
MSPDASIFSRIADTLESDWRSIARPEQLPPEGSDWTVWVYLGGRGTGKTRSGGEAVREWIETGKCGRVALIAPTAGDARDVMMEGSSGIMSICPNSNRPTYEPSKRRCTWPSGAMATLYSAEEADRLRGPNHDGLWADELAAWKGAQGVWDMAMMGLRLGKRPQAIVTTTPRPIPLLRALLKRDGQDVRVTRGRTSDNAANLAPSFLSQIVSRYEGTRLGRQELNAELLEDTPGALWTLDLIEQGRREKAECPPMKRIVVAVDPAVSVTESSRETGIIVGGLGTDGHGYVLADESGKYSPIEWARRAVALYHKHSADRVVSEINQGGAMVETTIRTVDPNVSFKGVHAAKAKVTRAEPVAALAEQFRIHHVGVFPELEDQLTSYEAGSSDSPDRLDALVWCFSELMVDFQVPEPAIVAPIVITSTGRYFPESSIYRGNTEQSCYDDKISSGFTVTGPDWPSPIRRNF